ncbi:RecA/RadA recombinase [plant metagenome]|uniref:RecA/RadA recombinase n=3 Tax=root TaxID=1 RepID=A0A1C3K729_9BURK|nr:translesion DNA synthesis-associated protein ImuA [Orrella dioscoreae]SBT27341.1 RecA/RadA recombinase [Orrella dioscoreae]SOE50085.1 RecA/RadA recombinase [Orrella dioscoreae]
MPRPEHIHPALWRGSQLATRASACLPAGHAALAAELPGGGWPLGSLTELLPERHGVGEIRLLRPALAAVPAHRRIVLLSPPYAPHLACWHHWRLDPAQLLWLHPAHDRDALWAAEQVLRNGQCGALLAWHDPVPLPALRRLHLAAQGSDMLFVLMRPPSTAAQASVAPLRVALAPARGGVAVTLLKRRGPPCARTLHIPLDNRLPGLDTLFPHVPLDQPAPAPAHAGRLPHALAQ